MTIKQEGKLGEGMSCQSLLRVLKGTCIFRFLGRRQIDLENFERAFKAYHSVVKRTFLPDIPVCPLCGEIPFLCETGGGRFYVLCPDPCCCASTMLQSSYGSAEQAAFEWTSEYCPKVSRHRAFAQQEEARRKLGQLYENGAIESYLSTCEFSELMQIKRKLEQRLDHLQKEKK